VLILLVTKKIQNLIIISLFAIIPTLLIWIPFFFRLPSFWSIPLTQSGMATIVANYDGPLYLIVAKTLYNQGMISANFQFPLPLEYYPAHFPLFPLLIRLLGFFVNYPYAMLIITIASSALAIFFFHKLILKYVDKNQAMFLTFLFSIFPARFLIVRSVGSADPLFVAAIIASIYYFKNKNFWAAGLWGAAAQLTKSPGILLFISYFLYLSSTIIKSRVDFVKDNWLGKLKIKRSYPLLLIPLALFLVFTFYGVTTGDFWAYFNSGDNIHLLFPPFQIFNYSAPWVGTFWLEEIIFLYLIGTLGVLRLIEKKEFELATFTGLFFLTILFVSHRDLMRYALPIMPFLFVAFSDVLVKKEIKIALGIIIIPIYLFSLAFISQNVMPISNWAPFL
jgi:Gpi18-like mannosyltransferase